MPFPPLPSIPIPSPDDIVDGVKQAGGAVVDGAEAVGGAIVDGAEAVGGAVVDGAKAVGGAVVDGAKAVGGAIVDGAEAVGEAIVDAAEAIGEAADAVVEELGELYDEARDAVERAAECVASNFEDFAGNTLFAVVDGAVLKCDKAPGVPGRLTVVSTSTPVLAGRPVATVHDHKPGVNIFPFAGMCTATGHPCNPSPVPPWIPAARGLESQAPLLPSNGLLVCSRGGVIAIADPGQTSVNVKSDGVPLMPPGVDLEANLRQAANLRGLPMEARLLWFYEQVKNGGPWDYKQRGAQYEDFGNYNYGATGQALGIPSQVLRRMAGWAQKRAGTSRPEWGKPTDLCGDGSFGDDPRDQEMIDAGIHHD
ncbi:PAAR-like protein [Nannocystis radixulma]|uniref:PAAR-like protein n=1 Tax=Nannocystis radixulma TaxID=2995305 RepID=A0ABT5B4X2_9BACT|nr:PAAR-like protein [Nannocystis radixulma]MDC0669152.1 PAAR-like protein [Nannocystis radixulma]